MPFNPFAGGPKKRVVSLGSGASSLTPSISGSGRTLPLDAAAALLAASGSGNGSGGKPKDEASLSAKLGELERQQPSWLISPSRLVLEQTADGQLVLLGRGSYGERGAGRELTAGVREWELCCGGARAARLHVSALETSPPPPHPHPHPTPLGQATCTVDGCAPKSTAAAPRPSAVEPCRLGQSMELP